MADPRPEPSMEDILASIKRIIADEPGAAPRPPQTSPVASPRTPSVAPPPPPPPPPRMVEPEPQRVRDRTAPPPWSTRPEATPLRSEPPLDLTDRAPEPFRPRDPEPVATPEQPPVQRAVERLRQAESELPPATPRPVPRDLLPRTPTPRPTGGDITLDALVRETIQPMLADWIEKNLPDMVERMVQAEIRRMIDKEA